MSPDARAIVRYNLARLGLLVGLLVLGYLVGLTGFLLIVSALLVSAVVSWFLLAGLRAEMIDAVQRKASRVRDKMDASAAREDPPDGVPPGAATG